MGKYHKTLEQFRKGSANNCQQLSLEEIQSGIAVISELLKGPMSNEERLLLVADRNDLRTALKEKS